MAGTRKSLRSSFGSFLRVRLRRRQARPLTRPRSSPLLLRRLAAVAAATTTTRSKARVQRDTINAFLLSHCALAGGGFCGPRPAFLCPRVASDGVVAFEFAVERREVYAEYVC